jgi:hypothetical protein
MEQEFKQTLFFIGNKLKGDGGFDMWKPLNAHFANQLAEIALSVAEGMTLDKAIEKVENKP